MAIYVKQSGEIFCDKCGLKVADFVSSKSAIDAIITAPLFNVTCMVCSHPEIPNHCRSVTSGCFDANDVTEVCHCACKDCEPE